jgi:hypothetical protein
MTKIKDLHKTWSKDDAYRKEYDALEQEFTVMATDANAEHNADLGQAQRPRRNEAT